MLDDHLPLQIDDGEIRIVTYCDPPLSGNTAVPFHFEVHDNAVTDLRQLDLIDVRTLGTPIQAKPSRNVLGPIESSFAKASAELAAKVDRRLDIFLEPARVAAHAPSLSIALPITVPVGLGTPGTPVTKVTIGVAAEGNAFAVIGVSAQAGWYGSPTPELGVFGSVAGGFWSNMGASIGPTLTILFGPPSLFDGWAISVGFDFGNPGPGFSGSIMAIYGPLPPTGPAPILGFAIGFAWGTGLTGIDMTVQVGFGGHKPLLVFK